MIEFESKRVLFGSLIGFVIFAFVVLLVWVRTSSSYSYVITGHVNAMTLQ